MLHVHHSNRLELLAERLVAVVLAAPLPPFEAETIVVPSSAVGRWLGFRLADALGVAANTRAVFAAGMLWTLFAKILGDVAGRSPYEPEALVWRFLGALDRPHEGAAFARMNRYLAGGDARRRHALARALARTFDRYLVYRPDWVEGWAGGRAFDLGPDEAWQAALWREIERARLQEHPRRRFFTRLEQDERARGRLPQRIVLFGVQAMPPMYVDVFLALSAHTEVHVLALNPCREYWGDIVRRRALARAQADAAQDAAYLEVGNALLASLGVHARAFFDRLTAVPGDDTQAFEAPGGTTMLSTLQRDVLDLVERGPAVDAAAPAVLAPDDFSLQIHVAHSAAREAEVLHDRLLDLFERLPDLTPSDIIVYVPDLAGYAPYIEAVFAQGAAHLPFSIADRGLARESQVVRGFLDLVALAGSRFEAEAMLAVLEVPAVGRRFDIDADDLPLLRAWLRDAGVRWGRDASDRPGPEPDRRHTWREGLDRLLLGYAAPGAGRHLFHGLAPVDAVEGSTARLVGNVAAFAEAVFALAAELAEVRTLAEWRHVLLQALAACFAPDEEEDAALQPVRDALEDLAERARDARYAGRVPLAVLREALEAALEHDRGGQGFLGGGITFAALRAGRPVPARVVALLGMNDDAFPRRSVAPGFDLAERHPAAGDRIARDEDRYAFLDALLAARDAFYVSYTGRSIRDNRRIPPSVVVTELVDAIRRSFVAADGGDPAAHAALEHPLQAFSRTLFDGTDPRHFSYSAALAAATRAAVGARRKPAPLVTAPLPTEPESAIGLVALTDFFANPARAFLRERVGIVLVRGEEVLEDAEPFVLDNLEDAVVVREAFECLLAGADVSRARALARAAGRLPQGSPGDVAFAAALDDARPLAERVQAARAGRAAEAREVALDLPTGPLRGVVGGIFGRRRIVWRAGKLRAVDRMREWILHLAWCAASGDRVETVLLATDHEQVYRHADDAAELLCELVALRAEGLTQPLAYFPRSSWAYAETARRRGPDAALVAAHTVYAPRHDTARAECDDRWIALAFRGVEQPLGERFVRVAHAVVDPALAHG